MATTLLVAPLLCLGLTALVVYAWLRLERSSGDQLAARRAEQPLAHELPYWSFLEDAGVGVAVHVDLTCTVFAELTGLDSDCLDDAALNQVSLELHGVLQNLPPGTVLQILHTSDAEVGELVARYREAARGAHPIGQRLVEARAADVLGKGGLRRTRLLLALSAPNTCGPRLARRLGLARPFPGFSEPDLEASVRQVRQLGDQVVRALVAASVRAHPLGREALRQAIHELLNPGRLAGVPADLATSRPFCDEQTAREQLALTPVTEAQDHLVIGDRLARVITLKGLPTVTEPAILERLLVELPLHGRVAFAVEVQDTLEVVDELRRRREQARMLAEGRRRNNDAEAQYRHVDELLDRNLEGSVRMVRISLSVVVSVDRRRPDAAAELDRQAAEVVRLVSSLHGAQAMVDDWRQLDEWLATLPGNATRGIRFRQCTSDNASHLLPAWQSWTGSRRPLLLFESGRGSLVGVDPFDPGLDNPNAFVAGSAGSGKSTLTNYWLLNLLATGAGALVVDIGGSYRRLIEIFGGAYLDIGHARSGHALNPFFRHEDLLDADGRPEPQRAQLLLAVVERMLCDRTRPELGNEERAILGEALVRTYHRVTARTPLLGDLCETLRDHRAVDGDEEDVRLARGLSRGLRVWTEGSLGQLVNRPSTVELTTSLAAFDLKGVEGQPDLRDVLILTLSGVIWNLVMRDRERKAVVFDEVWKFLATPASAALIAELYRTSRKYSCAILTLSQSVEDFVDSPIASALINNSATTYLLRHRREHERVAAQFRLNRRELAIFQGLELRRGEYTECLLLHGDQHALTRVVLTPLEYWVATTYPPDLLLEREYQRRHPGLSRLELLARLAARYPHGAPADPRAAAVPTTPTEERTHA